MYGYEELASYTSRDLWFNDCLLGLRFYETKNTDKVILAHETRIKELEAENERLKGELEKDVTRKILSEHCNSLQSEIKILEKRNDRLRCLALHAMSEWLSALLWLADTYIGKCLEPHIDVNLCTALRRKYNDAYRKAKKELKEGKS